MANELAQKSCVACNKGTPALNGDQARALKEKLPQWKIKQVGGMDRLERTFQFKDFLGSVGFVNAVTPVAEAEGHHPDLHIHWNQVTVELWTHDIGGLHENDFIMAAKIDQVQS